MGLFDLPAPLFGAIDQFLSLALPPALRLTLWGIAAGWLTMILYRRLSNQERIQALKARQKDQQKRINAFDGEFAELMPLIRSTLALGFRQLGLAIGPALLATVPVLFLVAWVAGAYGYQSPAAGSLVSVHPAPPGAGLEFQPAQSAEAVADGWAVRWPEADRPVRVRLDGETLLALPLEHPVPVIHQRKWWNLLFANPLGYLPATQRLERLDLGLEPQQFLGFGPGWMRGWMFLFFLVFLISSVTFKFILRID